MRAVKPAAARAFGAVKSVAKGTVNNMINGGTGTYKRNTVKQAVTQAKSDFKNGVKGIKKMF